MNPDTLVLGLHTLSAPAAACLSEAVPLGVKVIDSAESVAQSAAQQFKSGAALLSSGADAETEIRCFATDSVEKFERLGPRFLGRVPWDRSN